MGPAQLLTALKVLEDSQNEILAECYNYLNEVIDECKSNIRKLEGFQQKIINKAGPEIISDEIKSLEDFNGTY